MPTYQLIPAAQDWRRFCDIYNHATVYSPYTLPLDEQIIALRLTPYCQSNETFCAIALGNGEEAILHASKYSGPLAVNGDQPPIGMIHLLMASHNNIATWLLQQAEAWFLEHGLTRIHSCGWQQNPWQYILFGSEAYIWGGMYPAVNAFRRQNFDLELDVVVMSLEMPTELDFIRPALSALEITDTPGIDDFFARTGELKAFVDGKQVGVCGYQLLRAISNHIHKGLGQIYISADSNLHGQGVGPALLTQAHHRLYQLGARRVTLVTNISLFRAIKFYEKLGYRAETIRGYWFQKELKPG
jgi:GNAT superfamily N-acetyltransferase